MASYYVQNAKVNRVSNRFYGKQTAHDHKIETAFSKAVTSYMQTQYDVGRDDVHLDDIRQDVSRIPTGRGVVELKFKRGGWTR